jgi:hypothetical protein
MEHIKNIDDEYLSLAKRKTLSIENSIIIVGGFSFDLFSPNNDDKRLNILANLMSKLKLIADKTESAIIINLIFDELCDNKGNENINIDGQKFPPLKYFQKIMSLIYSEINKTRFIENKKCVVTFPQLFTHNDLVSLTDIVRKSVENPIGNDVIIVFDYKVKGTGNDSSFKSSITCDKLTAIIDDYYKITDNELRKFYYLPSEDINIDISYDPEGLSREITKIDNSLQGVDTIIVFAYICVCFGGSFDHYHIGHNVNT